MVRRARRAPTRSARGSARTRKITVVTDSERPRGRAEPEAGVHTHTTPHMSCLSCHACGAGTVPCNRTERARSRSSLRSTLTLHGSWGTPQAHSARRQPTRPDPHKFTTQTAATLSFDELTLQCRAYTSAHIHGPRTTRLRLSAAAPGAFRARRQPEHAPEGFHALYFSQSPRPWRSGKAGSPA
jgi:hypothetical protein